ncbi:MAG TPA: ATP-dependent 6-phosphofructokinase [Phycisphaerae bacterium]|jgi:phosphofructokinase-like protein|nr:6-phosphofructokinase [Phycisphaerae bacterium]HOB75687.1 ATP-dependent 6-phosphofructokinase [Phycisphaerae bacterium]HOJ53299.1 ATP-dependent 6-phosphofructokinase [Phycisphaerae bacterium]HOL27462.1 ATP-dependent 6-phosphofructokinase [Phycisphaerae bacterium]HPP21658.1 ATP-dependent 6-phosphofructokinase [Phycisphaerae bacterium]
MSRTSLRRIGILTGGGDCPGLNAVIRAVAKTAMFQYKLEVFGIEDGFLGLIENRIHPLSVDDVSNILTRGGTILGTSNRANPARFAVGKDADGNPIFEDVTPRVLQHAREHGLDAIICIGGDGTMTGAAGLAAHGLRFVGVPKTIDNDLMGTDITFGFQTAVSIATEALDRIHTTASSHHRVMLVEIMGRNAGWLTLHSGLASGADVILIPEIPYDLAKVGAACVARSKRGKAFTIIAVSEGARPVGGKQVIQKIVKDSPDPVRLGGISQVLAEQIEQEFGLECRATILGHVQRGGTPVAFDRVLATLFGHKALELALAGEFNQLVVMQSGRITSVPFETVAGKQRLVPVDHPLIEAARGVGTSFGDE